MFRPRARFRLVQVWSPSGEAVSMSSFSRSVISRFCLRMAVLVVSLGSAGLAAAQDRRQNAPGEFDFYVLALSWSPSYCEGAAERGSSGRSQQTQCGGRPYSFV